MVNWTYDGTETASRAVERLMCLACSLTLDFASSMEYAEDAAAVERDRTKVLTAALLLCADVRNFVAEKDIIF